METRKQNQTIASISQVIWNAKVSLSWWFIAQPVAEMVLPSDKIVIRDLL